MNWLLITFVIFHLPFGHIALEGFILCIGADGHLDIENACAQPTSITQSKIKAATSENHCGACVDLPLNLDCKENILNNPHNKQFKIFDANVQCLNHSVSSLKSPKHLPDNFTDIDNPPLKSLSTTILLI